MSPAQPSLIPAYKRSLFAWLSNHSLKKHVQFLIHSFLVVQFLQAQVQLQAQVRSLHVVQVALGQLASLP
jgi:NAD(P)H-dependent FMN reductase